MVVTVGSSPEARGAVTVGSSLGAVTVVESFQGIEVVTVGRRLYSERWSHRSGAPPEYDGECLQPDRNKTC